MNDKERTEKLEKQIDSLCEIIKDVIDATFESSSYSGIALKDQLIKIQRGEL